MMNFKLEEIMCRKSNTIMINTQGIVAPHAVVHFKYKTGQVIYNVSRVFFNEG